MLEYRGGFQSSAAVFQMKGGFSMEKLKRILALAGVVIILALYLVTFLLGVFGSADMKNWLTAALVLTVLIPVLVYAVLLVARLVSGKNVKDTFDRESEKKESK